MAICEKCKKEYWTRECNHCKKAEYIKIINQNNKVDYEKYRENLQQKKQEKKETFKLKQKHILIIIAILFYTYIIIKTSLLVAIIGTIILGIFLLKQPYFKGKLGETVINTLNTIRLDKNEYEQIKDITLKLKDETTTQIDHIIVSIYGIFVIETKNYKGWIYGDEKQKQWTLVNFKKKNRFQNPLHQNYKHIKALEEILQIDIEKIKSIVVFIGNSKFKTPMPQNVFNDGEYVNYIKSFQTEIINEQEKQEIINKINERALERGIFTDLAHVNNLRNR